MAEGVAFGNYRLLRRLARGGMAEVFLARQQGVEGFERRVAIKRILPHLSDSVEFRTMFLDEARLAAQLSHPNIIHIYDFGKVDDYYFIAMEYVEGVDLGRLIKQARTSPVPFELIAKILADICAGLHYAHNITDDAGKRLNVVHRDVTPQNVLVTYDGVVKVVDFGIAKATWQASRTRPGVVKGKYAYMSPEQVEGRSLDARSDIFSVGICAYELMTGVPLYRRDNVTEAMKEIRDGKPVHPEQHRSGVPHEIMSVLKKALSTARDDRYASAAAMQLDLERYLKGAAGLATPQLIGDFLRREAPQQPQGELLIEGKDGEPVAAPRPSTPEPPRVASGIAVKGGTAPISNIKEQLPAYDGAGPLLSASAAPQPAEPALVTEDLTTPGKHVRSVAQAGRSPAPTGAQPPPAAPAAGFGDAGDDELTRKDDRAPEARAAMRTPSVGERPVSGQNVGGSGQSGQIARPGKSLSGTPLGSFPSDAEAARPLLSPDPTAMTETPPVRSGARGWLLALLAIAALAGAGWIVRAHVLRFAARFAHTSAPDLRPPTPAPERPATSPRTDAPDRPATDPTPKVITTALPVQTSATIAIYTRPSGAKVFIDGQAIEALTPIRMQPVTAGPHYLVIERTGYQPRELDVSLKPGANPPLNLDLLEERSLQPGPTPSSSKRKGAHATGSGFLTAKTVPWSRAYDGAQLLGETPIVNVPLGAGPHVISFQNPDHAPVKKKIVIRVGEETKLNFSLTEP